MNLEIKNSLDWNDVDTEIRKLMRLLPDYEKDIRKMSDNVAKMVRELGQLEVIARNNKSTYSKQQCYRKVADINENLKKLKAFHTFALVSHTWP